MLLSDYEQLGLCVLSWFSVLPCVKYFCSSLLCSLFCDFPATSSLPRCWPLHFSKLALCSPFSGIICSLDWFSCSMSADWLVFRSLCFWSKLRSEACLELKLLCLFDSEEGFAKAIQCWEAQTSSNTWRNCSFFLLRSLMDWISSCFVWYAAF